MKLARVQDSCKPRDEVLQERLNIEALFMANFGEVIEKRGHEIYKNAKQFFDVTYPTENLKRICTDVFTQLSPDNASGGSVKLSTGFGGGKSHALIALWHLANSFRDPNIGGDILDPSIRTFDVRVAAMDLSRAGGLNLYERTNGPTTRTLWGELAYRLAGDAGYKLFEEEDTKWGKPTADKLEKLIGSVPTLILLDEIPTYLAALEPMGEGKADALLSFFQMLTQVVSSCPRSVLVWTEPSGMSAFASQTHRVGQAASSATGISITEIGRRLSQVSDPIGEEFEAVILKRLFKKIDEGARRKAQQAYAEMAQRTKEADPNLFQHPNPQQFAEKVGRCYPISPALFESARALATVPKFNSSRGAMRLFTKILRQVWAQDRQDDIALVGPGEIDWDSDIQDELLAGLDKHNFIPVCQTDVKNHAVGLDEGIPSRVHERAASAILFASLPQQASGGLNVPELAAAISTPNDDIASISDSVHDLDRECHYLYRSGERWEFRPEPNINKMIEDRATGVDYEDSRRLVLNRVAQAYGKGSFADAAAFVANPEEVTDRAGAPILRLTSNVELAKQIVEYKDAPNAEGIRPHRIYRCQVVLLAPEPSLLDRAVKAQQRVTAAEELKTEFARDNSQKNSARDVEKKLVDLRKHAVLASIRSFSRLVRSVKEGPKEYSVTEDAYFSDGTTSNLANRLLDWLKARGFALTADSEGLGGLKTERLFNTAVKIEDGVANTAALLEALRREPGGPAVFAEDPLRKGIISAVKEGRLVFKSRDGAAYDKNGVVRGPAEARKREEGRTPVGVVFAEDAFAAKPDSEAAKKWLEVSEEKPIIDVPPPPIPVPEDTWKIGWAEVLANRHSGYKRVVAQGSGSTAMNKAAAVLQLAGNGATTKVNIHGNLQDGGKVTLQASELTLAALQQSKTHLGTIGNLAKENQEIKVTVDVPNAGTADWLESVPADAQMELEWQAELEEA